MLGIFVPEFQADGIFNEIDYMRSLQDWSAPLNNFTICARIKMFFLRGEKNHFFSYANAENDDAINGAIQTNSQKDTFRDHP